MCEFKMWVYVCVHLWVPSYNIHTYIYEGVETEKQPFLLLSLPAHPVVLHNPYQNQKYPLV